LYHATFISIGNYEPSQERPNLLEALAEFWVLNRSEAIYAVRWKSQDIGWFSFW